MATVPCSNELVASSLESLPQPANATSPRQQSYGQILKSSALVGGSSVLNIGIGIVRTKTMALLLGPAGFGLFGIYGSIADLTVSIGGMGINSSGVRQIAEAVGSGDQSRIARTTAVLRRTSVALGVLGATLLLGFAIPVSKLTFGKAERAAAVSLLSIAVLFRLVSGGQTALIQGMRRIAELAKMNVLGALFGLCTSIPLVYFFRENGVVPSLVSVAAMTILMSWWFSRKIDVQTAPVTFAEVRQEASALLGLGFAFMASGFLTMGAAYVVRITVLHTIGFEATGLYQCAWTLGGLYVGIILQAMGADFYPRLTASVHNNNECNRLVNEQTLVGLLIAGPGVLATVSFAPLVISLLYSARFGAAVGILRWICLGATLQVITWPMGFIIVAKGRKGLFFFSELAWTIVNVSLAWFCVKRYGLDGAGIAFFGSYVFHGVLTYPIARYLTGFRWSAENRKQGIGFLSVIAFVFTAFYALPLPWAVGIGSVAAIASAGYSIRALVKLISLEQIPRPLRNLFSSWT